MNHIRQWTTLEEAKPHLPLWIYWQVSEHMQPGDATPWCGQFCLMMVTGCTFEEACKKTGQLGGTDKGDLMRGLITLGYWCRWQDAVPPNPCWPNPQDTVIAHLHDSSNKNTSHWIVKHDGEWYDPAAYQPGWWYDAGLLFPIGYIVLTNYAFKSTLKGDGATIKAG